MFHCGLDVSSDCIAFFASPLVDGAACLGKVSQRNQTLPFFCGACWQVVTSNIFLMLLLGVYV